MDPELLDYSKPEIGDKPIAYGGFGLRLVAFVIDIVLIIILYCIFEAILFPLLRNIIESISGAGGSRGLYLLFSPLSVYFILLLYHAIFESSKLKASPGKLALGMIVVNSKFKKLSFLRALLRNFFKLFSGMILYIGYLMIIWTEKKQGLHDMVASAIVIKK